MEKQIIKKYKALDINGNSVLKVFYDDNTTEIIRGSRAAQIDWSCDKFYKSLSGLYASK